MYYYIAKLIKTDLSNAEDNLYRATLSFNGLSPEKMSAKWGQSDDTPNDILKQYQDWKQKAVDALAFVEAWQDE